MKKHKLLSILLSIMIVLSLTFCTEDSTNPPDEELNDITNPPGAYINKLAINSQGDFFAGTTFGLYISTDRGSTWNPLTHMINSVIDVVDILIPQDDNIFIVCDYSLIFRSSDKGSSWTNITTSSRTNRSIKEDQYGYIYACGGGLHKSTDKGNSWVIIYNSGVYNVCLPNDSTIIIGIRGNTFQGQIVYSNDSGSSWDSTHYSVTVSEFYEYDFLIFTGGVFGDEGGGGVHKSTNDGLNWESCGFGLNSVTSFNTNILNQLFIGTDDGIYYTRNKGITWQNVLSDSIVTCLMRDEKGYLYAGTNNGSFLRSTDNGMSWHN